MIGTSAVATAWIPPEKSRSCRCATWMTPSESAAASVTLTDAGRQLLTDAGPLLASAHAVRHRVTVAARGSQRLTVGFRAGITATPAVRQFATQHPNVIVDMQRIESDDQATMLLDGRIDVGYVRLPIDETGLRVTPLYTEPRVAVLPAGHRLAGKEQITEADLAGEPLVWHMDTSTQPTRRPHPNAGYLVRGVDETLEHVAAGRGVSFLARSATVFYSHPEVSYVPIPDLTPDQVCLAVAASRTSPLVDDFLTAVGPASAVTGHLTALEADCVEEDAARLEAPHTRTLRPRMLGFKSPPRPTAQK